MKSVFLLLSLCLFNVQGFAVLNGTTLKGSVQTAELQPAEFAVVTLLDAKDSSLVKGAIVTADGSFVMEGIAPGKFLLTTMFTGYAKNWYGPFEVDAANPEMDIPAIVLSAAVNMNEVTVTAVQPLYVQKPDMLIMNVENSPVRMSGTVFDLIQKVPGVTVNQNGVITMKGRSGVQVYVDGKPTYLAGDQLKQFLENMPAADVSRVEIITNPSSKYDAEGNSGILNIVTKKGSQQGLNGRARAGLGYGRTLKEQAGFSMNYGMPKVNFYSRYDFTNWKNVDSTNIDRIVPYNNENTYFTQRSSSLDNPFSHSFTIGADLKPNDKNTYGIQVSGNFFNGTNITNNNTKIRLDTQDSVYSLNQHNDLKNADMNGRGGLWFKHVFDTNGRELSISADVVGYQNKSNGDFETHYYTPAGSEFGTPFIQKNATVTNIGIAVGQIDYTHPFGKKYKLETGFKSSVVKTDNDLHFDVLNNNTWQNDTTRSNRFIYKEQINAAYAQASADWGKLQVQAGLRAEQTNADGQSPTTGQQLTRSYLQFFPSLFITQKIDTKNSLTFNYSRRINRPDYENLNPFLYYLDQYTYQVGNPFLQPEITHHVELTHSFMDFIFTTVGASRTNDAIMDVTDQNDSTGATFQTSTNLNKVDNAWANLSFGFPIGQNWMMENSATCVYLDYRSPLFGSELSSQSWMWMFNMQHSISLPKDFKLQVSGFYQTGLLYGMFNVKSQGSLDVGISKSFLENKLSVNLGFKDLLYTSNTRVSVNFQNQNVYLINKNETRRVFMRVNYSFGNAKAARRTEYKSASEEIQKRAGKKD
jgi:iron complex outermembrane recepter protein